MAPASNVLNFDGLIGPAPLVQDPFCKAHEFTVDQCIHPVWMQMILTKANTLLQLKEVGSHSEDAQDMLLPVCALRS